MGTYWFNHGNGSHTIVDAGDIREALSIAELHTHSVVRDGMPVSEAEISAGIGDGNRRIVDLRDN